MRLLVVEDEPSLNAQVKQALEQEGFVVDTAFDGEEAAYLGQNEPYDLIILDIGLPQKDGLTVLEDWRAQGVATPVLILTARDRWSDKVKGMDAGADDYVAKPFQMEEVLARVRAILRRAAGLSSNMVTCGPVVLDLKTNRVTDNGMAVRLTAQEYRVLAYMLTRMGKVISRTELTEHIYDQDFDRDSNTIEVFVGRLRQKLSVNIIETVRGMGYRVNPPDQPASS
jgi:two-component system, OmpR family, response regulator